MIPGGRLQGGLDALDDVVVVDVAGGCDDERGGRVVGLVVLPHVRAADLADRLGGAADGTADGAVTVDGQLESLVNGFRRRVLPHRQLVEDDAALHREIILVQARVGDHVGQRLDRHVQVGVANARPVRGVLAGGLGVGLAADAVEGDSDVKSRALIRALEEEMLEEVSRSRRARSLITRAHRYPQGHARTLRRGNRLGQHTRPSTQDCALDARVTVLDGQAGLVERQRLRRHSSPLASPRDGDWHETFTV